MPSVQGNYKVFMRIQSPYNITLVEQSFDCYLFTMSVPISDYLSHVSYCFAQHRCGVGLHPSLHTPLRQLPLLVPEYYVEAQHCNAFFFKVLCKDIRQSIVLEYGLTQWVHIRRFLPQQLQERNERLQLIHRRPMLADFGNDRKRPDRLRLRGVLNGARVRVYDVVIEGPGPAVLFNFDEAMGDGIVLYVPDFHAIDFRELRQQFQVLNFILHLVEAFQDRVIPLNQGIVFVENATQIDLAIE